MANSMAEMRALDPERVFGKTSFELFIPHVVEIDRERDELFYDTSAPRPKRATIHTFWEFIALNDSLRWGAAPADANPRVALPAELDPIGDQKILEFARKWGPFGLCEDHQLPMSHSLFPGASAFNIACNQPTRFIEGMEYYVEPLAFWRRTVVKIRALCEIGNSMAIGGRGRREDWLVVRPDLVERIDPSPKLRPLKQWAHSLLSAEVEDMIGIASLRPEFYWQGNRQPHGWSFETIPRGIGLWPLFGWITFRLMAELCEANGTMIKCPYCQNAYRTKRRPGSGQHHHCKEPKCRKAYFREYRRGKRQKEREKTHG